MASATDAMTSPAGGTGRFARFVTVGVGAALLLFLLSWLFAALGFMPLVGSTIAYAIAFAVAYTAQRFWTFGARHSHGHALPRYFAVQAGCAVFSGVFAELATRFAGVPPVAVAAATTVAASGASYVLSAYWVFSDRSAGR